MNDGIDN